MESPVVTSAEMRAAEEAAFARGVSAESLMDEAARGIARTVEKFFPQPGRCLVFAGKGNNAGDAFAAAEILHSLGWEIGLRLSFPETQLSQLARKKLRHLRGAAKKIAAASWSARAVAPLSVRSQSAGTPPHSKTLSRSTIILDGLLGLGAKPPLRGPIREACREINRLRCDENAFVLAIDFPSGLGDDAAVVANCTVTIGAAKRELLDDDAINFVGCLEVVPLEQLQLPNKWKEIVTTGLQIPRRDFSAYKNQFGRIGVVAGSKGLTGAALLCSLGALRAGAGLVELFVPEEIYPIAAGHAAPEVMVKPIASYKALLDEPIDVWALGPGLGRKHAGEILKLIRKAKQPMVVDADGLNVLAENMAAISKFGGPRLLTPHPGEIKRLAPKLKGTRAEIAQKFCAKYKATLLLKGSRTIVAQRGHALSYNTTGNPGMATGGMGDVLTGVCAALIGQKLSPYDAARLGAWLCGRAAEIAIFNGGESEQSLLPSDVLANLGRAFRL